jgi:Type ISP C-terminal specificity domain/N-6 DNA Methylase
VTLTPAQEKLIRNAPKSVPNLIEFLSDFLNWPLPPEMDPSDVTPIDWSFEDLHLNEEQVAHIKGISQLPKFTDGQRFGVFVMEMDGGKLPLGAVRRVVNQMILKRRAQRLPNHQQWNLGDIIIFCQNRNRQADLHVVHFQEIDGKPLLRTISWASDSTKNRIEVIAAKNLNKLLWPNQPAAQAVETVRQSFGEAFSSTYREGIKNAAALARTMAEAAKEVRAEVLSLYAVETQDGPIRSLFDEVRNRLNNNLTLNRFADMYAQTMVYGLLTARITHPEQFRPGNVTQVLKFDNPFLDSLYARFRTQGEVAVDLDEFGLRDLSSLLTGIDVDEILADFGTGEHRDDPVVFFYEEFLQEYDPEQKKELGTFYTPIPVVRFMVDSIDEILEKLCLIEGGVSSSLTWGEYSLRESLDIPAGLTDSSPLVTFLDPATGTGTYVLELMRKAFKNLKERGSSSPQTRAKVVNAIDAFEISLSSYSVAELKVNLELDEETRERARPNIRLTDSLEGNRLSNLIGDDALAVEGREALAAKFDKRHSVVLGNPPYLRTKSEGSGGWVTRPIQGEPNLFKEILNPSKLATPIKFSYQSNLYNLYVYFWRLGMWKAFEQLPSGPAVLGFITASSWLRGPGFVGLRSLARQLADEIFVIDLGGDGVGVNNQLDENIFPIQTPVSIVIMYRKRETDRDSPAKVNYTRLTGSLLSKLDELKTSSILNLSFEQSSPDWFAPFVPGTSSKDWDELPSLTDVFPWQQPGCMFSRTWPISPQIETLRQRWQTLVETPDRASREKAFSTSATGRGIDTTVGSLRKLSELDSNSELMPIVKYAYRPFDYQFVPADPRLAKTESPALWSSLSDQQVFLVTSPNAPLSAGPGAMVASAVPDKHFFNIGGKDVIPLYRDRDLTPNLDPGFLTAITQEFLRRDPQAVRVSPESFFAYTYGVLAGSDYTERFRTELQTPGIRIPVTLNFELFKRMANHGASLINLHTFGERTLINVQHPGAKRLAKWEVEPTKLPETINNSIYDESQSTLRIGDGVLRGVDKATWDFKISTMPILKKWLAYRTKDGAGRSVSSESPLDRIRPEVWDVKWSKELAKIVDSIQASADLAIEGIQLLNEIMTSPLLSSSDLPEASIAMRKVPPTKPWWEAPETLF